MIVSLVKSVPQLLPLILLIYAGSYLYIQTMRTRENVESYPETENKVLKDVLEGATVIPHDNLLVGLELRLKKGLGKEEQDSGGAQESDVSRIRKDDNDDEIGSLFPHDKDGRPIMPKKEIPKRPDVVKMPTTTTTKRPEDLVAWENRYKNMDLSAYRFPDAIIIGVPKAGTAALMKFLSLHPKVRAPDSGEVSFFDNDEAWKKGPAHYADLLPKASRYEVLVEKSAGYWIHRQAPARIRALIPRVKLIVLLREPTTRSLSLYHEKIKHPEIWPAEARSDFYIMAFNSLGQVNWRYGSIISGLYCRYLDGWLNVFPRDSFLFLDSDALLTHPGSVMKELERFLGLPHEIHPGWFRYDAKKGFHCYRNPKKSGDREECLPGNKGRKYRPLYKSAVKKLNEFYAPFNDRIFRKLGIHFDWPLANDSSLWRGPPAKDMDFHCQRSPVPRSQKARNVDWLGEVVE